MRVQELEQTIGQKSILKDLTFSLAKNEIVGLIGRNGSGKTTLFRTIAGQYQLKHGELFIDDMSVAQHPEKRQEIFYIDEKENFLSNDSLNKIGQFYRAAYPKFNQDLFLELLKTHQLSKRLLYKRLSKGRQGLFLMILAIVSNASYLLLDEPFDGLDVIVQKQVIGLLVENLSQSNRSALIASHNLNELEGIIDRALVLKGQTIVQDYRLETLREQARKIQFVFKAKQIPEVVKQHSKVIQIQGRVITALFEQFPEELASEILSFEPLLFEELPLTLEDLFEANLNREKIMEDER